MKSLKIFAAIVIVFITSNRIFAQTEPSVEIILSQPTAQFGDTVTADVVLRNGTNIGGADIGMQVDERCLQITGVELGTFLPSAEGQGGFSPFSETTDHTTRQAIAITDRSKLATGSGIFYRVQLEVICDGGTAPLTINFAELSAYRDPAAETIDLIAYRLTDGTLTVFNTQLEIVAPDGSTAVPVPTQQPSSDATPQPDTTPSTQPEQPAAQPEQPVALLIILPLACLGVIFLIVVFWIMRRPVRKDDEENS